MLLKENPRQKYTVMATYCHETIFHPSDSTSSFCFHSYFGGPFDIILTGSTVEKLVELHIFCIFLYNCFNPHMHEIFLQYYCMKWVPGDPLKEMIN